MEKNGKCIEVRTVDGKPLFTVHVYNLGQEPEGADSPSGQKPRNGTAGNSNEQPPMTDAQKRYLFRILAEKGFEGDSAHEHLKQLFGVSDLQEVNKREASRMIEKLLEEAEKK